MFAHPVTVGDRKQGGWGWGAAQQPQRSPTLVSADHRGCKHKPAGGDFHLWSACTQNLRVTPQIKSSTFWGVFFIYFFFSPVCRRASFSKRTKWHVSTCWQHVKDASAPPRTPPNTHTLPSWPGFQNVWPGFLSGNHVCCTCNHTWLPTMLGNLKRQILHLMPNIYLELKKKKKKGAILHVYIHYCISLQGICGAVSRDVATYVTFEI